VGAVQKLATVVIVGLVALATVLVLYLADEDNRINAEEKAQEHDAIERAIANYISLCLRCHGPAGEGITAPGEAGTGRIGAPLGGDPAVTDAALINQEGVNGRGTPVPGGVSARATVISQTIHDGRPTLGMPAWAEVNGGPLNDAQIEELVVMIQHVDWNEVYNESLIEQEVDGETVYLYPTAEPNDPRKTPTPADGGETPTTTETTGPSDGTTVDLVDIAFEQAELRIAANTDVVVTLVNKGAAPHTFDIDDLNIHSGNVDPGTTTTVTINAAPGEYEYYCEIPGHKQQGMVGKLIVK
jgi:plastocyanin/mono/diheme cytochrome c family protein